MFPGQAHLAAGRGSARPVLINFPRDVVRTWTPLNGEESGPDPFCLWDWIYNRGLSVFHEKPHCYPA